MKRVIVIVITLAIIAVLSSANAQMFAMTFGNRESAWTPASLNPTAWYKGDGNAKDATGNYDGKWVGTEAYTNGPTGQAFNFNGASGVNVTQSLNMSNFTLTAWTRLNSATGIHTIMGGYTETFIAGIWICFSGGKTFLRASDGITRGDLLGAKSVDINEWVFVTVVVSGNTAQYLVDTIPAGTTDITGIAKSGWMFNFIGLGRPSDKVYSFLGQIDDVLLFDRALTAEEITKLYNESINKNGKAW